MSTAWETYHRRSAALRDVVDELEHRDAAELPWDDRLAEAFGSPDGLLVALHDLWARRLLARIEMALELHDIPEQSVAEAVREVSGELAPVCRLLERYAGHPALRRSEQHLHRMVAVSAGWATLADPVERSAALGREFLDRVRTARVPAPRDGWIAERLGSLFSGLRASA